MDRGDYDPILAGVFVVMNPTAFPADIETQTRSSALVLTSFATSMAGTLCCAALINPVVHIYSMLGMVFWMTLRHEYSVCGKICHRSNNLKPGVFCDLWTFNAKLASMKLKRHYF